MDRSRVLTRLEFKNWRSLRHVPINDLTPITVFIGANSSGKTNILDALRFIRYSIEKGIVEAVFNWGGRRKIRTLGVSPDEAVELQMSFWGKGLSAPITDTIQFKFKDQDVPFMYAHRIAEGETILHDDAFSEVPVSEFKIETKWITDEEIARINRAEEVAGIKNKFYRERLQLLGENFAPPISLPNDLNPVDPYLIEQNARNAAAILNFMQQARPGLYKELQYDLQRLIPHIDTLETERNDREPRFFVREKPLQGEEAATISAGTARILAILTAYYALDMRSPELPGLVVIEEPDTAIHPLLLGKLVDLLRSYTDRDEPRQFILTTHNPELLNYFQPEEVRVVERDEETGETSVDQIPDYIHETWLTEHQLGEGWLSRVFGGIPEE